MPNFAYFLFAALLLLLGGAGIVVSVAKDGMVVDTRRIRSWAAMTLFAFGVILLAMTVLDYFGVITRTIGAAAEPKITMDFGPSSNEFSCTIFRDKGPEKPPEIIKIPVEKFYQTVIPNHPEAKAFKYRVSFPGKFSAAPNVVVSVNGYSGVLSRFDAEAQEVNEEGFVLTVTLWNWKEWKSGSPSLSVDQLNLGWVAVPK